MRSTFVAGALGDDVPAVLARARAHVDEPVGRAHHLLVVLDDEHGVAEVAQPLERSDELVVVALVETDRRLVEDVEHADELRADLGRQPQALRLAARERRRRRGRAAGSRRRRCRGTSAARGSPSRCARRSAARSRSARARSRNASARVTDICVNSWMFFSPTVTASTSGFSRAPLQTGHGRNDMYSSIRSRCVEESVSR